MRHTIGHDQTYHKDNTPCLFHPGVEIWADENQVNPFEQIDNELAPGGAQIVENQTLQENLPSVADANTNDTNNNLGEDGNQYPWWSTRAQKLSAAGSEMRNIPYETHLERAKCTMHGPQEGNFICHSDNNITNNTEIDDFLGLAEDDPHTYQEAAQAYDAS